MGTEIGDYIRELRGKKSLREFSKIIDISHTYLSDLEKGKDRRTGNTLMPSPSTLAKISDKLDIDYLELFEKAGYVRDSDDFRKRIKKMSSSIEKTHQEELGEFKVLDINRLLGNVTVPIARRIGALEDLDEKKTNIFLNGDELNRRQAMMLGQRIEDILDVEPRQLDEDLRKHTDSFKND